MMKFKSLKCFNIFHMGKCFFCMQFITSMRLLLFIFVVLLSSCSMNSDNEITYDAPKIVFENAKGTVKQNKIINKIFFIYSPI